ncbi:hypothetical protein ACLPHD_12440 [Serratia odorifera]|uniref:phage tail terminator protein n=1 Tax=Serratia odorifera TaxID=618 RepID=UPI003D2B954B
MKLTKIIGAIRRRVALFEGRVAGAAEFKNLPDVGKLSLPAAYVIPNEDTAAEQKSQTDYWQDLTEGFSVVVVLSNLRDERGQSAGYDAVHDVRAMLWRALLGWSPESDGNIIQYAGGEVIEMDRSRLYYRYDFTIPYEITEEDTAIPEAYQDMDDFKSVYLDVDYIDPGKGPDGCIEHHTEIHLNE